MASGPTLNEFTFEMRHFNFKGSKKDFEIKDKILRLKSFKLFNMCTSLQVMAVVIH